MDFFASVGLLHGLLPCAKPAADLSTSAKVDRPGLVNVYRITAKLFSGAAPEGDTGFDSLERLGVKTVISVDAPSPMLRPPTATGYGTFTCPSVMTASRKSRQ